MTAREAAKALAERMSRPLHPYQPDEESLSSEREYWKRVQALDKERSRPYSAEELEAMALRNLEVLTNGLKPEQISERFRYLVHQFSLYFAGDGRFGGSLDAGIILEGSVGTGKTTLFRAFNFSAPAAGTNPILSDKNAVLFRWGNCNEVAMGFCDEEEGGVRSLNAYKKGNWLFDDLGTETVGSHYGTKADVMGELVLSRYRKPCRTFFTTNLPYEGIQREYGARVASRLAEMCNWIKMGENTDHRGTRR